MPPAFNLSQDQTLQFNPWHYLFASPLAETSLSLKVLSKENLTSPKTFPTREHFQYSQSLYHRISVPLSKTIKEPGDNPLPIPVQRPSTTKHPHASVVYVFKEQCRNFRRPFPAKGALYGSSFRGQHFLFRNLGCDRQSESRMGKMGRCRLRTA
jgi:hypothetical protein